MYIFEFPYLINYFKYLYFLINIILKFTFLVFLNNNKYRQGQNNFPIGIIPIPRKFFEIQKFHGGNNSPKKDIY